MQVQIQIAHGIPDHAAMTARVDATVKDTLSRLSGRITRVEVHVSDEDGDKSGPNDKRCMIEARLQGLQPLAVTHQGANVEQAVEGAADKLSRLIESTLGRLRDQHGHATSPTSPRDKPEGEM